MFSSAWCSPWEVTPENHSLSDSLDAMPQTFPHGHACPDWGMLEKRSSRGCVNVARNCKEASFKTLSEGCEYATLTTPCNTP